MTTKYPGRKTVQYKPRKKCVARKSCKGRNTIQWNLYPEGQQAKMLAHKFYEFLVGESVMERQRQFGDLACMHAIKAAVHHIPKFHAWFLEHSMGKDCLLDPSPRRKIPCGAYRLYQRVYQAFRRNKTSPLGSHLVRSNEHYLHPSQEQTLAVWEGWAAQVVEAWAVNMQHGDAIEPYKSHTKVTTRPVKQSVKRRYPDLPDF